MTSIERTAYPQFRRLTSARVLHVFFTPTAEEIAWARERTASPESLFALVLALKCFQKMARFCPLAEIPEAVTGHVRRCLGLDPEAVPDHGAARTAKWHRSQVRARQGVRYDQRRARALAAAEIRAAALVKNRPPDLINVALERLVEASLELPAFSTLDELATTIRAEVNAGIFTQIVERMGPRAAQRLQGLLTVEAPGGMSMFQRLKSRPSGRPGQGSRHRRSTLPRWMRSAIPAHGWRGSPRPRSPTSPGRRPPRTSTRCPGMTRSSGWRWWPAWCTPRGCGPAMTWPRCCASGSRRT